MVRTYESWIITRIVVSYRVLSVEGFGFEAQIKACRDLETPKPLN